MLQLIHTILDFPFPTIACITGHTFGGACMLSLAHDYRVMNSERGFFQMPPINMGLHFDGMGSLPRLKLQPRIAWKLLMEAHKYTGKEALEDGIIDAIAPPARLFSLAMELAEKWKDKARMEVYGILRAELLGEAVAKFKAASYVHSHRIARRPGLKL
jgi:enoyl-CoA hydratase/carnithine racemase